MASKQMPYVDYRLNIKADRLLSDEHEWSFNIPTISEVRVVIVGQRFDKCDVIFTKNNNNLKRSAETHRPYDEL